MCMYFLYGRMLFDVNVAKQTITIVQDIVFNKQPNLKFKLGLSWFILQPTSTTVPVCTYLQDNELVVMLEVQGYGCPQQVNMTVWLAVLVYITLTFIQ